MAAWATLALLGVAALLLARIGSRDVAPLQPLAVAGAVAESSPAAPALATPELDRQPLAVETSAAPAQTRSLAYLRERLARAQATAPTGRGHDWERRRALFELLRHLDLRPTALTAVQFGELLEFDAPLCDAISAADALHELATLRAAIRAVEAEQSEVLDYSAAPSLLDKLRLTASVLGPGRSGDRINLRLPGPTRRTERIVHIDRATAPEVFATDDARHAARATRVTAIRAFLVGTGLLAR